MFGAFIFCASLVGLFIGILGTLLKFKKRGWKVTLSDASPALFLVGCLGLVVFIIYERQGNETGPPPNVSITVEPQTTVPNDSAQQAHVPVGSIISSHFVIVDYKLSIESMVEAGRYDYRDGNITDEHFPFTGEGWVETEILLVHFDPDIKDDMVIKEMEQMGLRQATLPELLALGATHPKLQYGHNIVALGSSWVSPNFYRPIPCLSTSWVGEYDRAESIRVIQLIWYDRGWNERCWFAAVRE